MSEDIAQEIGTLEQCLKSNLNRIQIALILLNLKYGELLPTVLEDLLYHVQDMVDKYCVEK